MTDLLTTRDGAVAVLTLNRPEKRNALTADLCRHLSEAIRAAEADARVVLIRGEGSAFCAGADLSGGDGGVYGGGFHEALFELFATMVGSPLPIIADIQGPAVGAGTQLALACDLRVAGEKAWFGVPAAAVGFALDGWTIHRAQQLLGGALARLMLIANHRVGQEQAAAVGFVVPAADGGEFARMVASLAPLAMRQLKEVLNFADQSYELNAQQQELYDRCWASADAREAQLARAEKREPVFKGC